MVVAKILGLMAGCRVSSSVGLWGQQQRLEQSVIAVVVVSSAVAGNKQVVTV